MRKLRFIIGLLAALSLSLWAWTPIAIAQGIGPAVTIYCNKTAQVTGQAAGTTQLIPGVAGQIITLCGWHVTNSAAAQNFRFFYGTGSNCITGLQPVTPPFSVSNTAPSSDHTDYGHISLPSGNAFCVDTGGATVSVLIYYATT